MKNNEQVGKMFHMLLILLLFVMAVWLGYVVLHLRASPPGLNALVGTSLDTSGVSNPVTAVLLNFRGYDTLLEMGVLLLALLGVLSLGSASDSRETPPGLVLDFLSRLLVPVLILVSGYLLWAGAHAPGGAFQAGAVLGAAAVLLLLSGWHLGEQFSGLLLRAVLILGIGVFILAGIVLIIFSGNFLEYPQSLAGAMILMIETAAMLSIGVTLAALFQGIASTGGQDK